MWRLCQENGQEKKKEKKRQVDIATCRFNGYYLINLTQPDAMYILNLK